MKPPVLLLLLTNRKRGPDFLRAVLSVLHDNSLMASDVTLIRDTGDDYGTYIYDNRNDRPPDEQKWYDLLTHKDETIKDLIHFWQQFCLNWPCLADDLQKLSMTYPDPDHEPEEGTIYIVSFARDYPILFECLYAVFGAMMSNSRLAEQVHGMMRHGLRFQYGMDQADHHRQFASHQDYIQREERRSISNTSGEVRSKKKRR